MESMVFQELGDRKVTVGIRDKLEEMVLLDNQEPKGQTEMMEKMGLMACLGQWDQEDRKETQDSMVFQEYKDHREIEELWVQLDNPDWMVQMGRMVSQALMESQELMVSRGCQDRRETGDTQESQATQDPVDSRGREDLLALLGQLELLVLMELMVFQELMVYLECRDRKVIEDIQDIQGTQELLDQ